jgi:hypothetical protein
VQNVKTRTQLDHLTGAVLVRHFDADGRLVAGECRWCRQVVPSAKPRPWETRVGAFRRFTPNIRKMWNRYAKNFWRHARQSFPYAL